MPTHNKLFRESKATHHMTGTLLKPGISPQHNPHRITGMPWN